MIPSNDSSANRPSDEGNRPTHAKGGQEQHPKNGAVARTQQESHQHQPHQQHQHRPETASQQVHLGEARTTIQQQQHNRSLAASRVSSVSSMSPTQMDSSSPSASSMTSSPPLISIGSAGSNAMQPQASQTTQPSTSLFAPLSSKARQPKGSSDRRFFCPQCNSAFAKRSSLVRHFDGIHRGLRNHACPYGCGYRTNQRCNLERHERTHHRHRNNGRNKPAHLLLSAGNASARTSTHQLSQQPNDIASGSTTSNGTARTAGLSSTSDQAASSPYPYLQNLASEQLNGTNDVSSSRRAPTQNTTHSSFQSDHQQRQEFHRFLNSSNIPITAMSRNHGRGPMPPSPQHQAYPFLHDSARPSPLSAPHHHGVDNNTPLRRPPQGPPLHQPFQQSFSQGSAISMTRTSLAEELNLVMQVIGQCNPAHSSQGAQLHSTSDTDIVTLLLNLSSLTRAQTFDASVRADRNVSSGSTLFQANADSNGQASETLFNSLTDNVPMDSSGPQLHQAAMAHLPKTPHEPSSDDPCPSLPRFPDIMGEDHQADNNSIEPSVVPPPRRSRHRSSSLRLAIGTAPNVTAADMSLLSPGPSMSAADMLRVLEAAPEPAVPSISVALRSNATDLFLSMAQDPATPTTPRAHACMHFPRHCSSASCPCPCCEKQQENGGR